MSTRIALSHGPSKAESPLDPDFSCVVISAEWNSNITRPLADGAVATLVEAGVKPDRIVEIQVPGTVELTFAAARAIKSLRPKAVIVIGCVIRGETPHFDYVCQSVTEGVTRLNARGEVPVIFSVLTVENEQQALDRAGGMLGNKGSEGAATAIAMANLAHTLPTA